MVGVRRRKKMMLVVLFIWLWLVTDSVSHRLTVSHLDSVFKYQTLDFWCLIFSYTSDNVVK